MKTLFKTQIRIILVFFITFGLYAQTHGSLDTSFDIGNGFNQGVLSTALQPDGKILVGGAFIEYNWEPQNRIIRLNTDGSLDDSFNIGTGFNNLVFSIAVQPDGKIIIGGGFTAYNGTT